MSFAPLEAWANENKPYFLRADLSTLSIEVLYASTIFSEEAVVDNILTTGLDVGSTINLNNGIIQYDPVLSSLFLNGTILDTTFYSTFSTAMFSTFDATSAFIQNGNISTLSTTTAFIQNANLSTLSTTNAFIDNANVSTLTAGNAGFSTLITSTIVGNTAFLTTANISTAAFSTMIADVAALNALTASSLTASTIQINTSNALGQLTNDSNGIYYNGSQLTTGGSNVASNWSLYPAISNVNIAGFDVSNVGSLQAGGVTESAEFGTGIVPMFGYNVYATNVSINSYNPISAMNLVGVGGINMTAPNEDINLNAGDINLSQTDATSIMNLTALGGIVAAAGAAVDITAGGAVLINAGTTIQILAPGNVSIGSGNVLGADTEVEKVGFSENEIYKAGTDDLDIADVEYIHNDNSNLKIYSESNVVISTNTGVLQIDANAKFQGDATFLVGIADNSSNFGTAGQVLTAGSGGQVVWQSAAVVGTTGATGATGAQGAAGAGGALGYYGSFYDTTDQTNAATVNPVILNTTAEANGVSIVSNSRITITNAGTYNIQFSAVFQQTTNSAKDVDLWLRKNGTDVPDTNGRFTIAGNDSSVESWNYVLTVAANDYLELVWYSVEPTMRIEHIGTQSTPTRPATPSIIVTVQQVMYLQQGPTGATGASGIPNTWSLYPAISNVDMAGCNISGSSTITSRSMFTSSIQTYGIHMSSFNGTDTPNITFTNGITSSMLKYNANSDGLFITGTQLTAETNDGNGFRLNGPIGGVYIHTSTNEALIMDFESITVPSRTILYGNGVFQIGDVGIPTEPKLRFNNTSNATAQIQLENTTNSMDFQVPQGTANNKMSIYSNQVMMNTNVNMTNNNLLSTTVIECASIQNSTMVSYSPLVGTQSQIIYRFGTTDTFAMYRPANSNSLNFYNYWQFRDQFVMLSTNTSYFTGPLLTLGNLGVLSTISYGSLTESTRLKIGSSNVDVGNFGAVYEYLHYAKNRSDFTGLDYIFARQQTASGSYTPGSISTIYTINPNGNINYNGAAAFTGGISAFNLTIGNSNNNTFGSPIIFNKSINGGNTTSGTELGYFFFSGYASGAQRRAGYIIANQDGASSGTNVPGRISFFTTNATTGEAERMRIDSSGNVGIGTTNPQSKLEVNGSIVATTKLALNTTGSGFGQGTVLRMIDNSFPFDAYQIELNYATTTSPNNLDLRFVGADDVANRRNFDFGNYTNNNRTSNWNSRFKIDSYSGDVTTYGNITGSGGANNFNGVNCKSHFGASITNVGVGRLNVQDLANTFIDFRFGVTQIGSVTATGGGTATSYNTTSDYRLKDNIVDFTDGLETVKRVRPVKFNWRKTGEECQGFIAHEFQSVLPNAVHGEKDEVDEEGNPMYQAMDASFLISALTSAVQQLSKQNEELEARLLAMEAATNEVKQQLYELQNPKPQVELSTIISNTE